MLREPSLRHPEALSYPLPKSASAHSTFTFQLLEQMRTPQTGKPLMRDWALSSTLTLSTSHPHPSLPPNLHIFCYIMAVSKKMEVNLNCHSLPPIRCQNSSPLQAEAISLTELQPQFSPLQEHRYQPPAGCQQAAGQFNSSSVLIKRKNSPTSKSTFCCSSPQSNKKWY